MLTLSLSLTIACPLDDKMILEPREYKTNGSEPWLWGSGLNIRFSYDPTQPLHSITFSSPRTFNNTTYLPIHIIWACHLCQSSLVWYLISPRPVSLCSTDRNDIKYGPGLWPRRPQLLLPHQRSVPRWYDEIWRDTRVSKIWTKYKTFLEFLKFARYEYLKQTANEKCQHR